MSTEPQLGCVKGCFWRIYKQSMSQDCAGLASKSVILLWCSLWCAAANAPPDPFFDRMNHGAP